MTNYITQEEVASHNSTSSGYWAITENYVVDLTSFLDHHPGGVQKIMTRKDKSVDITSNFMDHFGHTVSAFREACRQFDQMGGEDATVLKFRETGDAEVKIIGKIKR